VQVVERQDALDVQEGVSDVVQRNCGRHALEENKRSASDEGESRREDDDCDDKTDDGIAIVLEAPRCQPDDRPRDNHADISQCVAQDVKKKRPHIHRSSVRVAVLALIVTWWARMRTWGRIGVARKGVLHAHTSAGCQ